MSILNNRLITLFCFSAFLALTGCPEAEEHDHHDDHHHDAGSSDGNTDGSTDGTSSDAGNADGSTDGSETDAGPAPVAATMDYTYPAPTVETVMVRTVFITAAKLTDKLSFPRLNNILKI